MSHHHEEHHHECGCNICKELRCIHNDIIRILKWIALKEIDFVQVGGGMNYSQVAGTTASFQSVLTPADGAQAAGTKPQWTASDTTVQLVPSADGLSCDAILPLPYLAASYDLTESAVSSDPAIGTLTVTHTITVTQPVPPPPALTAIDFVQTAG